MGSRRALLFAAILTGSVVGACSKDEAKPSFGLRGESCETHRDCVQGLSCKNEICVPGVLNIGQYPAQCGVVQCREPADCTNPTCDLYKADCDAGITASCTEFAARCHFVCEAGNCIQTCADPATDPLAYCAAGNICDGNRCVTCVCDTDCATGSVCRGNTCWEDCETDSDCTGLRKCDDGVCVARDCASNRECIALTGDPLEVCVTGKCVRSCSSDLECGSPTAFNFTACLNGVCAPLGCTSADECRALTNRVPNPALGKQIDVCEPAPAPLMPGAEPSGSQCGTGGSGGAGGSGGTSGNGGTGGLVGTEPCCTVHATAGCSDSYIQQCVCTYYPVCCVNGWDQNCVTSFGALGCGTTCGTGGSGGTAGNGGTAGTAGTAGGGAGGTGGLSPTDCCVAHGPTPGCDDLTIETCVCTSDPDCCGATYGWDGVCVLDVEDLACGVCP